MKKLLTTCILLAAVTLLSAHEFWLQPDKFIFDPGEQVTIRFNVGENFEGENWTGDSSRVNNLDFYYDDLKDGLLPALGPEKGDSVQFSILDEGTYMVSFNSKNSFIHLDSAKFNAYLMEDGLNDALAYRKDHGETDSMGHEAYQRSVKTIFQVGKQFTNSFLQSTGLPLDIMLQQNPYAVRDSQVLDAKIFFRGEPLRNELIKIWHREKGLTVINETVTDENGEISFPVLASGEWMLSCVKMIHINGIPGKEEPAIEWQSYWASCTWGYY